MAPDVRSIFLVAFANFFVLGLVWLYVASSYRNLSAARFWSASIFLAAVGAAVSGSRGATNPLVPILLGNGFMQFAICLAWMGTRRFFFRSIPWLTSLAITGALVLFLLAFSTWRDDIQVRIAIVSIGACVPLGLTIRELLLRMDGRRTPGISLAIGTVTLYLTVNIMRTISTFFQVGGDISFTDLSKFQATLTLTLVMMGVVLNFAFLLMAVDRLRAEVSDLALTDDLTGVSNRRRLQQRLADECVRAQRTAQAFALLVVDLDDFKAINDGHGHSAGDKCLIAFVRAVQTRLRETDLLARAGGDEFCIVLPATTLREAGAMARQINEVCRRNPVTLEGGSTPVTVSIGVAQWSSELATPQKLLEAADQALYEAKKLGRDRYALHQPAPGDAPLKQSA